MDTDKRLEIRWQAAAVFSRLLILLVTGHGSLITSSNADTHYVSLSGSNISPYTNWATAATSIQAAINAASAGDTVLVTNGVYSNGSVAVYGASNRVAITKPIAVQSVNGPGVTTVVGKGPMGPAAVRCVYIGTNASLNGFTLTNGFTRQTGGPGGHDDLLHSGGGAWCESSAIVSNCVVKGNSADKDGGGAFRGTLLDCVIAANTANENGGGVARSLVRDSFIVGNQTSGNGGGVYLGVARNCLIFGNDAGTGGGVYIDYHASLEKTESCTIAGNSGNTAGGIFIEGGGGGSDPDPVRVLNCIVYSNSAASDPNWASPFGDSGGTRFSYTCTDPLPAGGINNFTNNPQFVSIASTNVRLRATSPCADRGINRTWAIGAKDVDGLPRIISRNIDLGAHETKIVVQPRVFLQGAYRTNVHAMASLLTTNGFLPTTSPFAGDATTPDSIISNTVDWVLVQLRRNAGGVPVFFQGALLRNDGRIMSLDGSTGVVVTVSTGQYFVAVMHRNHAAVMTASAIAFTNTVIPYDFTTNFTQSLGGTNSVAQVESNTWALIAGDADGDGVVGGADRLIWETQAEE